MIVHIFKDKHKVAGDINSLNLLVLFLKGLFPSTPESSEAVATYCKNYEYTKVVINPQGDISFKHPNHMLL